MSDIDTKIVFLLLLLVCSGFLAGAESALLSLGRIERYQLARDKESLTFLWLQRLIRRPGRLLITFVIGTECARVIAAALGAGLGQDLVSKFLPGVAQNGFVSLATFAVVFPLILLVGELIPRALVLLNPRRFSQTAVFPLMLFSLLVTPVRVVLENFAKALVRLLLRGARGKGTPMMEREFRALVDLSRQGGELGESEREFIHNIFEFGETQVSELMTPRADMVCLRSDQSLVEVLRGVEEHHFSRIPVYGRDMDDILGILYSKDLILDAMETGSVEGWDLAKRLRRPYFVPQTKKASDLFREFRSSQVHLAIVVDEYGGVAGLVTMDDLLEELFGEIFEERSLRVPKSRQVGQDTVIVQARMPIDEFNRRLGADFSDDEYDTLGGFVFHLFGRLPAVGSKVSHGRFTFTIEKMRGTRIVEIRVRREPAHKRSVHAGPPMRSTD